MKEFEEVNQIVPDKQIVAEIQKEYTLRQQIRKKRGLILFAVDTDTWTATQVKISTTVTFDPIRKRVLKDNKAYEVPGKFIIYEYAINSETAVQKVLKSVLKFIELQEAKKKSTVKLPPLEKIEMKFYHMPKRNKVLGYF